jgi:hypothetical protein
MTLLPRKQEESSVPFPSATERTRRTVPHGTASKETRGEFHFTMSQRVTGGDFHFTQLQRETGIVIHQETGDLLYSLSNCQNDTQETAAERNSASVPYHRETLEEC